MFVLLLLRAHPDQTSEFEMNNRGSVLLYIDPRSIPESTTFPQGGGARDLQRGVRPYRLATKQQCNLTAPQPRF